MRLQYLNLVRKRSGRFGKGNLGGRSHFWLPHGITAKFLETKKRVTPRGALILREAGGVLLGVIIAASTPVAILLFTMIEWRGNAQAL